MALQGLNSTLDSTPLEVGESVEDRSPGPVRLSAGPAMAAPAAGLCGPRGLLDLIGGTPLLDLSHLVGSEQVRLYGKAEFANPGGSVKDRPALAMVLDAERRGLLEGGRRILDATSGNTGIALAMIGAAKGYGVTLCMPENASPERKKMLRAYDAEVILTDALEGGDGAIREARKLAEARPDLYAYLDQYSNPENWKSHLRTTGPEIWAQTGGRITHLILGLGTTGTYVGVSRFLRRQSPDVRIIALQPEGPLHGIEGMKHLPTALVPEIYDSELAHTNWTVETEDAYSMVRRLARECGLRLGISAGANVAGALRLAQTLEHGTVVTVLCDNADKYLSDSFWEDES